MPCSGKSAPGRDRRGPLDRRAAASRSVDGLPGALDVRAAEQASRPRRRPATASPTARRPSRSARGAGTGRAVAGLPGRRARPRPARAARGTPRCRWPARRPGRAGRAARRPARRARRAKPEHPEHGDDQRRPGSGRRRDEQPGDRGHERDDHRHARPAAPACRRVPKVGLGELGERLRGEPDDGVADREERRGRRGDEAGHELPRGQRRAHRQHPQPGADPPWDGGRLGLCGGGRGHSTIITADRPTSAATTR